MARTLTIDNVDGFGNGSYISINGTKVWEDGDSYPATFTINTGDIIKIRSNGFVIYGWGEWQLYFDDTLNITAGDITISGQDYAPGYNIATINYTEIPRKSVDLTTLAGWEGLSSGSHNIQIVAKADGFKDSAPSAAVQVEKAAAMPVKGDIITLDSKQYRVLKTEGTVAEVLCMYDANSSIKFDSASSGYNNTYAGKNIDTYCNDTFYSGLSAAMKSAIVDKTFTQDSWSKLNYNAGGQSYAGKYSSSTYYLNLNDAAYGTSITRHCYCLSVQDVLDYLEATTSMGISDTTLTDTNVWKMFWNVTTSLNQFIWLRSAYSSYSNKAFNVRGDNGELRDYIVSGTIAARPAFQIDLSKVEWTKQ